MDSADRAVRMDSRSNYTVRRCKNWIMSGLLIVATVIAVTPLFAVLGYVVAKGIGSINVSFLTGLPQPLGFPGGGMANAIVGTLTLIALSGAIGIPIGILSAIYLSEYDRNSWFANTVRFTTDVLMGIPSIIIGIVVYASLVLMMGHFSAISAGVALAIIMVPTISRMTEEMLRLVPYSLREAAYALGFPKWRTTLQIVLPAAMRGIITGVMLGVARVAGETAPLLFTAFGNQFWSKSVNEPIAALPMQIYIYAMSPYKAWHEQAWAGALVLISLVVVLNLTARLALRNKHA
ncbi:MAG: phosphate ABC transporter permease PstA [Chloroflexi bacterium]|nr:phosphate ABC transporter permease PstA [Chloroflexota bacterium]